jgi:hypothetical protein
MFKENSFDSLVKNTNKKPQDIQLNLDEEFERADNERDKEEIIAGIQENIREASVRFKEKEDNERAKDWLKFSQTISEKMKDINEK